MTSSTSIKWSDLDKARFYGIGTGLYTAITVGLHPITVIKIRQQASTVQESPRPNGLLALGAGELGNRVRALYRGIGVVLALAIPGRCIYISTLEISRDIIDESLHRILQEAFPKDEERRKGMSPWIASCSGGMAGGLAAMSSQMIIVPMDIVSQHQMVMSTKDYHSHGKAVDLVRHIRKTEGWKGFYRGFGISLVSSLPTGSIWWATYSGCQEWLTTSTTTLGESKTFLSRAMGQVFAGSTSAILAVTLTQPLDVLRTRIQVHNQTGGRPATYGSVSRELLATSGVGGFYKGVTPRILHLGLWGTILSGAYEFLRHVSRKDYEWFPN